MGDVLGLGAAPDGSATAGAAAGPEAWAPEHASRAPANRHGTAPLAQRAAALEILDVSTIGFTFGGVGRPA